MNRAHSTRRVLGFVFTTLGALLLALGLAQLAFWWNRTLGGLTIEPIVVPLGLIFVGVGLPKLLTARRVAWLERHGVLADAEVITVTPTRQTLDRVPVVEVELRLRTAAGQETTTRARWPLGAEAGRLVPGRRLRVRTRPGRPGWVMPA